MKHSLSTLGLLTLSCVTAQASFAKSAKQTEKSPNIIFILIDDMGINDLGCYGNPLVETPVIDNFASEGMVFTQAYASPVSSATRTSILSGQNTARHKVWEVLGCNDRPYAQFQSPEFRQELPEEIETYADILTDAGYDCGIFGKWHAGRTPEAEGFGGCDVEITDPELQAYAKKYNFQQAGKITAQSIEFMRKNQDKPFMLCVSHFLVHAPLTAPKQLTDYYSQKIRQSGITTWHPEYLSMIDMVDNSVDMVLSELRELGLEENTIVILSSDNGGLEEDMMLATPVAGCNDPYRSQKGDLYEGGIHIPFIVKWPGRVEAGASCDEVIINYDLFSTFLELGGATAPADQVADGLSLVPLFKGEVESLEREAVHWHFPTNMWTRNPMGAIRKGNYKLIENFTDGSVELYDVVNDKGEVMDLSTSKSALAAEMLEDLHQWREEIGAEMPTPNPNYDPLRAHEMAQDWWKDAGRGGY
ncbi:MAG: sulfatase [Rikenellaceae bacterium]